ncbi:MAG: hypothetical protein K8T90_18940 [Planctomycetes bacterium]|nr:hypothetical protein [Planctomycetota bacterium]
MLNQPSQTRTAARVAFALLGALVAGAAQSASAADDAPFYGARDVDIGDRVTSAITKAGEVHQYTFFATKGSVLNASLAPAAGSGAHPTFRLTRPGGDAVALGHALRTSGARTSVSRFKLPFSGYFTIEVASSSGTGGYVLQTSGGVATSAVGIVASAPEGANEFRFHGVGGATVSVSVMPRGRSRARPVIESILGPDGAAVYTAAATTAKGSTAKDVALPADGRYTVVWRNDGAVGDVQLKFAFKNPALPKSTHTLPASAGTSPFIVDKGSPALAALPGYVGSDPCGRCHDEIFRGWAASLHNLAARTWDRPGLTGKAFVNDVDKNGIDDFRDGLDLATVPAFATYGANAPKLSHVAGDILPYKITIGSVRYDVARVMGGNGQWKQRYLVAIGTELYPSPVQFNDSTGLYATYDPGDWYSGTPATTPKWSGGTMPPQSQGFNARCSGCHNTGEMLVSASGQFQVGHVDFNIGCEQCHGPGKEHVEGLGDKTKIRNPRAFIDGTPAGVAKANEVCGRCHTRGTAKDAYPGVAETAFQKAGFGWTAANGVAKFGDTHRNFFDITKTSTDYWGQSAKLFYTDPNPSVSEHDDFTWIASRSHRQQSLDLTQGNHGPVAGFSPTCFDCHDPHVRNSKYMIRATVQRGATGAKVAVKTGAADNSLCLSCHAGFAPYGSLTLADVAQIGSGTTPDSVKQAVNDHMKDIGMPVSSLALYDPAGTGVGRCETCHMPTMEKTAVNVTDKAGFTLGGDEHVHTFQTVNPRVSRALSTKDGGGNETLVGPTNSCNVCHPTGPSDIVGPIIAQWATDNADKDGTFHADRPRNFQNGIANPNRNGGLFCVQCHTTEGFVRVQVNGETIDQAKSDAILKKAYARYKGISCDACHGKKADGTFAAGTNPLRLPKAQLCGQCHNAQSVVFADFQQYGEQVRHPMKEMMAGTAGAEVPGAPAYTSSFHSAFTDGCVTCHFNKTMGGQTHQFGAQVQTCSACHGVSTFDRPSLSDWDGDGVLEGIQTEIAGLLNALQVTLTGTANVTFAGGSFEYNAATDHKMTGASDAQKRAAYNWYTVTYDASKGVHNAVRSIQLLQRSIRELNPAAIPAAVMR